MTNSKLDEIKRRIQRLLKLRKKAKPGPWYAEGVTDEGLTVIDDGRSSGLFDIPAEAREAEAIVAYMNDAPDLLRTLLEVIVEIQSYTPEMTLDASAVVDVLTQAIVESAPAPAPSEAD